MKIIVPIKRVVDYNIRIRVKSDQSGVETLNIKMSMNPFDEIAVEQAIRTKEAGLATEIILVSIGTALCQDTIRNGLALGADRGILVQTDNDIEPLGIAKILKAIIEKEQPGLVILGKQSIDGDNSQTGQMLAALLGWPQGTFASKLDIDAETATIVREIDGGLETLKLTLPAIITTDLRLNEPRYASLPNIMKAKKKTLDTIMLNDLNLNIRQHTEILKVESPAERKAGVILKSVDELIHKLSEVGVIKWIF